MLRKMQVQVAFATSNRERVDRGLEDAEKIAVYEVGLKDVRSIGTYTLSSPRGRTGKCKRQKLDNTRPAISDKKKPCPDNFDEEETARRIAALDGVSVLVVNKDLQAYTALMIKQTNIYSIKLDNPEFIGVVITQLQELMESNTPLWLRRNIERASI